MASAHARRWGLAAVLTAAGCSFTPAPGPAGSADASSADAGGVGGADASADAGGDAGTASAADAAIAPCPAGYAPVPGLTSQYRLIGMARALGDQHRDCVDDLPGRTHLVILDSPGETATLRTTFAGSWIWVGLVQRPGQGTAGEGWRWLDDTEHSQTLAPWANFFGINREPNDDESLGLVFETNEENGAVLDTGAGLVDVRFTNQERALCECDGRAIEPAVGGLIP